MTEKDEKLLDRYIMHDTIHKLHHEQHKSLRWTANHLGINFRTVKKFLNMDSGEFQKYSESITTAPVPLTRTEILLQNVLISNRTHLLHRCTTG